MGRNLKGAVVLVTGASSGIGMYSALEFAHKGARLALAARRKERLEKVAAEIERMGGEALVVPADVSRAGDVDEMVARTVEHYGTVDVLLNNAGYGILSPIEETTAEEMRHILDVNYMGTYMATRAVLPVMKRAGRGHIINVSSVAGTRGLPYMGAYCVTKAAQKSLTEALRIELAGTGIYVSVVYPVFTETEFFDVMKNKTGRRLSAPSLFTQTAEHVARRIVRCAENPRPEVLPFPLARVLIFMNALAPGLVDFVLKRYYKSFLEAEDGKEQ